MDMTEGIVIKKRSKVKDKYDDVSNDLIWTTVIDCDSLSQNLWSKEVAKHFSSTNVKKNEANEK